MAMFAVVAIMAVMTIMASREAADAQKKAGEEARRIAELNAANIEAEKVEKVRVAEADLRQTLAYGMAKGAASGTTTGGSTQIYLEAYEEEGLREIDWIEQSGAGQINVERYKGASAQLVANANANATMWQGYASAARTMGSYGAGGSWGS